MGRLLLTLYDQSHWKCYSWPILKMLNINSTNCATIQLHNSVNHSSQPFKMFIWCTTCFHTLGFMHIWCLSECIFLFLDSHCFLASTISKQKKYKEKVLKTYKSYFHTLLRNQHSTTALGIDIGRGYRLEDWKSLST